MAKILSKNDARPPLLLSVVEQLQERPTGIGENLVVGVTTKEACCDDRTRMSGPCAAKTPKGGVIGVTDPIQNTALGES